MTNHESRIHEETTMARLALQTALDSLTRATRRMSEDDPRRVENARRIAEIARLITEMEGE